MFFGCATVRRHAAKVRASDSGVTRQLVDDPAYAFGGEQRDRARARRDTALDGERFPRRARFVLGEAERVLAGIAERGAVDLTGPPAADVADDELECTADRRVGAIALPERIDPRVHTDGPCDRTVDDDERAREPRRREQTVHVELVGAGRLERGEHDRQVLRQAARHHRVDRHLLDRALDEVRRHDRDDVGRDGACVPAHMRATRSGVGGTSGRPSLHPRAYIASLSSSASPSSTVRACRFGVIDATRRASTTSGSWVRDPQPGRQSGRPTPRSSTPVNSSQRTAFPAVEPIDDVPVFARVSAPARCRCRARTTRRGPCRRTRRGRRGTWDRPASRS